MDFYGRVMTVEIPEVEGVLIVGQPEHNRHIIELYCSGKLVKLDEVWYENIIGWLAEIISDFDEEDNKNDVEEEEEDFKYYRVRKSWEMSDTQIGVFNKYENAVACADANPGYKVYDNKGNLVYDGVKKPIGFSLSEKGK